ncbi:MAG: SDR family NAD(P)-dependent oxidoreductase [Lachnospiraceae bacterium]|nr:SDR family NAD(P)-dependent oxidoreductase [Lachnospiraceae bacterium]
MSERTVLVTGASRGIGKAIALRYASEGCRMVINCLRREEELMQTKKEIEELGAQCLAFVGDAGDEAFARKMVQEAAEAFGTVDVLVNNAGISFVGLLTDMTGADWERILKTNLTSVFHLCSLCVPGMVAKKAGKIVNISSVWGKVGASCEVAYSATKGGVNAMTKALAKELAPSNVQVNAVACGFIDTEINHFLTDEEVMAVVEDIPAGRAGRAEEVADLVYALTDGQDYLTGQVISLDGGWI